MKDTIMSWRPGNDNGDPVARVDKVHDRVPMLCSRQQPSLWNGSSPRTRAALKT
jgi:hypothetical protein